MINVEEYLFESQRKGRKAPWLFYLALNLRLANCDWAANLPRSFPNRWTTLWLKQNASAKRRKIVGNAGHSSWIAIGRKEDTELRRNNFQTAKCVAFGVNFFVLVTKTKLKKRKKGKWKEKIRCQEFLWMSEYFIIEKFFLQSALLWIRKFSLFTQHTCWPLHVGLL